MTTAEVDALLDALRLDARLWPVQHELDLLRAEVDRLRGEVEAALALRRVLSFPRQPPCA